ncbi:unnamed protein product [Amoebophrya sp. A25]|nr:unnamed protein product [Amoebophrya sp. A25]|eukprot:GSA25T00001138001.1
MGIASSQGRVVTSVAASAASSSTVSASAPGRTLMTSSSTSLAPATHDEKGPTEPARISSRKFSNPFLSTVVNVGVAAPSIHLKPSAHFSGLPGATIFMQAKDGGGAALAAKQTAPATIQTTCRVIRAPPTNIFTPAIRLRE